MSSLEVADLFASLIIDKIDSDKSAKKLDIYSKAHLFNLDQNNSVSHSLQKIALKLGATQDDLDYFDTLKTRLNELALAAAKSQTCKLHIDAEQTYL